MQSRRPSIVSHYYRQLHGEDQGMIKASAAERRYKFRKPGVCDGAVVRIDLNGYSEWAEGRTVYQRANLLNTFFTKVVDCLDKYEGIYFRDEGDCIVAIFSTYFETASPYISADAFCKEVIRSSVDEGDALTAKAIVAVGEIAFYQKLHEVEVGDWSAEGEPFVRAVRVEQAVESKPQIYYFANEFDDLFNKYDKNPFSFNTKHYWEYRYEKKQIQGLKKSGGWEKLAIIDYIPGGKY